MGFFDRIKKGLGASNASFKERMNIMMDRGPDVDEDFWDELEEALILSDLGAQATDDIIENLRDVATRKALSDGWEVLDLLVDEVAASFTEPEVDVFDELPRVVLFVGINGTGKTTTVGKLAARYTQTGKKVLLGSGDTFRAAAIEQLEVWSKRAGVEMVTRERGSDPASVCYETIERAEELGSELVLIDTAGRLHTSDDLMRELEKVVNVVRKRSQMPVTTLLVIDATTGQNGLQQAREFNKALALDGLIVTKLDGTAKGGIAVAVSHELGLPIYKIGVGEGLEDLDDFDAHDFAHALIGELDDRESEDSEVAVEAEEAVEASELIADDEESAPASDDAPSSSEEAANAAVASSATGNDGDMRTDEPASASSEVAGHDVEDVPEEPAKEAPASDSFAVAEVPDLSQVKPVEKPMKKRLRDWWPQGL